jgi:pimeloyl-ACP methyl ester carboxylesterase
VEGCATIIIIISSMMDTVTTTAPDKQLRLRAFAWMALQTTYSSEFLYHQQRDKVEGWIQFLIDNNSVSGLGALLEQTYPTDRNDPWHVESMAKRISSQQNKIRGCLLVGDEDVMAPVESARELAAVLSWSPLLHTVESCGHAVPLQKPREWRQHVLDFLSP